MAVNKNFVVKNGLEVNNQLLFVDATTNRVGIASTQPNIELDVRGGIAATNTTVSGVSTVQTELRVGAGIAGTVFTVLGVDNLVGVGTSVPAYILDVRAPVSTGQTALYVHGDARITGDINIDDITLDYASIGHMVVSAASTFGGDLDINGSIDVFGKSELDELNVTGLSTFTSNVDINADLDVNNSVSINSGLAVTGITTFTGLVDINGGAEFAGVSTFSNNVDINADVDVSNSVAITGGLSVTGMSTFTGIGTFDTLYATEARTRKSYPQELEVVGISTLGRVKIFNDGTGGIVTATTGIITYYGDGQFLQNIVSGVGIASTNPSTGYSEIVGLGATIITFAGPGISTAFPITVDSSSGIATITFQGGGSGGGYQTNIEKDVYTVGVGGSDIFTTSSTYSTGYVDVFINGSRLPASDFTETDSTTITLDSAAVEGDVVELVNFQVVAITGDFETQIFKEEYSVTAATQSVFSLSTAYTAGYIDVYLNGVKLSSSDYAETDSTTITLTTAAKSGDIVQFVNFYKRAISDYENKWADNYNVSGIHTNAPVGIGTSIPTAFVDIHGGLNVVGVTTLGSNVDINADVDISGELVVDGTSDLDYLNVSGISTFGTGDRKVKIQNDNISFTSSDNSAQIYGTGYGGLTIETGDVSDILTLNNYSKFFKTGQVILNSGQQGNTHVGSAITFYSVTGIVSATSYYGSGANLTDLNIPSGFNELDAALFN